MPFLTKELREQLLANGRQQAAVRGTASEIDFYPVVKLFTPDAAATWLLTEIYPDGTHIAFGLCDLGLGFPELGDVSLAELSTLRSILGLPVDTTLKTPGASAVIYGGVEAAGIVFDGVDEALRLPGTELRLFGKPESFVKRRMGVALARDADVERARTQAKLAAYAADYNRRMLVHCPAASGKQ